MHRREALIVVEARAALAAAKRGRRLTAEQHADAREELDALLADLHIVEATEALIAEAAELAGAEALRGHDAVHLATALLVGATVLSSADTDLCAAGGLSSTPHRQPADGELMPLSRRVRRRAISSGSNAKNAPLTCRSRAGVDMPRVSRGQWPTDRAVSMSRSGAGLSLWALGSPCEVVRCQRHTGLLGGLTYFSGPTIPSRERHLPGHHS